MTRSKHEAYFAQLWEQQAAKRERFAAGGSLPATVNAAAKDARPSTSRGGVVPVPTFLAVAPIQRAKADASRPVKPVTTRGASSAPIYPLVGLCRTAGLPIPTPEHQFHPPRGQHGARLFDLPCGASLGRAFAVPIRHEMRARYPKDWALRSRFVRFVRARGLCEWCGAAHGQPHPLTGSRVVLTTAHVHDDRPEASSLLNLAALCQKCHNGHDMAARRAGTRERKRAHTADLFA